jgi:hypothetical protein
MGEGRSNGGGEEGGYVMSLSNPTPILAVLRVVRTCSTLLPKTVVYST